MIIYYRKPVFSSSSKTNELNLWIRTAVIYGEREQLLPSSKTQEEMTAELPLTDLSECFSQLLQLFRGDRCSRHDESLSQQWNLKLTQKKSFFLNKVFCWQGRELDRPVPWGREGGTLSPDFISWCTLFIILTSASLKLPAFAALPVWKSRASF